MSLHPANYQEYLQRVQAANARPRKALKRGRIKPRKMSKRETVDGDCEKDIKDELDGLVRKILRLRDKKCVTFDCPRILDLHVSHYIKRGVLALRWSLQNCNLACDSCNQLHNTDQKPYRDAMFLRYDLGVTWRLEEVSRQNPRLTYVDLLAIRDGLREELNETKSR